MKRVCVIVAVVILICALFLDCAANPEKKQLFVNGFYEILSDDGGIKPPDGIEWGFSVEEVARAHGLELNEKKWVITGGQADENGVVRTAKVLSAVDMEAVNMFGRSAHCVYNFWEDELFACWYQYQFDKEDAQEALDFAKSIEKEARKALGDSENFLDSIITDIETTDDLWAVRQYQAQWNFKPDGGGLQIMHVMINVDDGGLSFEARDEQRSNLVPEDIVVWIDINYKR